MRLSELLGEYGWTPARKVGSDTAVRAWEERGIEPFPAALAFVSSFDGITFTYPRHPLIGGMDTCILDAEEATRSRSLVTFSEYRARTGHRLCPVGQAASRHLVLMISPDGGIYGGYDDFLALYGESPEQALWNIYHRVSPYRVP